MLIQNREIIEEKVRSQLGDKRFAHTQRVTEMALRIAKAHKVSEEKVWVAAMLHDFAKDRSSEELIELLKEAGHPVTFAESKEKALLHAPAAAILAQKELGITDKEILDAIRYHTTGYPGMGKVAKIVYLADAVEPSRKYKGVEKIRELAMRDLKRALLLSLQSTLMHLLESQAIIHPASIEARNQLLSETSR